MSDQPGRAPVPPPALPQVPGLRWRPLSAADLDPWYALIARMQDADHKTERQTRPGLERSLNLSRASRSTYYAIDPDVPAAG